MRWFAAFLFLVPFLAWGAEDPRDIPARKLATPPVIDGTVGDDEWAGAARVEGTFDEQNGTPGTEPSTFYVAYDKDYIYFAARFIDSKPGEIRALEYRTNGGLGSDDWAEINLDPIGNLQAFSSFAFNPRGANSVSIAGGRAAKVEWTGEILTKARITESGWEGEARIPWQIMRLPDPGKRIARINFERRISRLQRTFDWRFTGNNQVENMGRWVDVETPAAPFNRVMQVLPYIFLGSGKGSEPAYNGGFDLRTKLTPRIEAVATVSPDFRNIENDILSLDFSYFERLAGEVRPFFAEGRGFFNVGGGQRIFASQRVRGFDAGARVYGNVDDKTSFGVMALQDFGDSTILVGSAKHNFSARRSTDVAFVRSMQKSRQNDAVRASYTTDVGQWNAFVSSLASLDSRRGKGANINAGTWRDDNTGSFWFNVSTVDRKYAPLYGNAFETNYKGFETGTWRFNRPKAGAILETNWNVNFSRYWRQDGDKYRWDANGNYNLSTRKGLGVGVSASRSRFQQFKDQLVSGYISYPENNPKLNGFVNWTSGDVSGRKYRSQNVNVGYRPSPRLQSSIGFQWLDHFERARQVILGGSYDLGKDHFLSLRGVQTNNDQNIYFSLRKSGAKGNDYFLIFGDPNARTFRPSIVFKAVMPFEFRF